MGKKGLPTPEGWGEDEKRPYQPIIRCTTAAADRSLSSGAYRVLSIIVFKGGGNGFSFDGIEKLVEKCGLKQSIIREHIQELKRRGYLCEQRRKGTSSIYTLGPLLEGLSNETKKGKVRRSTGGGAPVHRRSDNDNLSKTLEYPDIDDETNEEHKNIIRWFDTDDCELIKALVVDTEEKQELKPPDNNEVDWIISDRTMRDCKISEYGPVGFGTEKYPAWDNIPNVDTNEIWAILNGKEEDNPNILDKNQSKGGGTSLEPPSLRSAFQTVYKHC
jgi:DNA-binding transcriptional ArsR family regulator